MSASIYRMTVDLNVLKHLGIKLYSNTAAVLTEAVANAWDADAEHVKITIAPKSDKITILDDGVGMTVKDMNAKYLRVGYRRRQEDSIHGTETAKGRPVMGRKGLGKLSLFSIARTIEVFSCANGAPHGLRMSLDGIQHSVDQKEPYYSPESLEVEESKVKSGTELVLRDLKLKRLGQSATALRKRLARRFSVIGDRNDFHITINDQPVTVADRGDLSVAQFLWTFGTFETDKASIPNVLKQKKLPATEANFPDGHCVNGWIGTARLPKQLDSQEIGNLNSIVVFARGRLFHENILESVNDGRLYTKYLTGQIEADFLDTDEEPDIATSGRQRIQEDDPRYVALRSFLQSKLSLIEGDWNAWRRKYEVKQARKDSPALEEWFASLPVGYRKVAETLIGKLSAMHVDKEVDRKDLFRHGILAFERMKLRGNTAELVNRLNDFESLLQILADRDALEASLYSDIVRSRLDVIDAFQDLVDDNSKEKILQQYLFDHLWLLDPAWERATEGTPVMESRLIEAGVIIDDMTKKEKLGRVDIAYRTNAGKHIIVELKRAGRKMKLLDLQGQGQGYVDKLKKILNKQGENFPNIEVIFVVGKAVKEETDNPDRVKASMLAVSPGSRIVHYDSLIHGAQNAYAEYLKKTAEFDRIERIINRI